MIGSSLTENMESWNTYAYGRMRSQYSENCLRQWRIYEGMGKVMARRMNVADCVPSVIDFMA